MSFVEGASEIGEFNFVVKEMELDLDRYLNITVLSKCLKNRRLKYTESLHKKMFIIGASWDP